MMFVYRDEYYNRRVRAAGRGRRDHRQAPQRADRRGRAHLPAALPASSRACPASAAPSAAGRRRPAERLTAARRSQPSPTRLPARASATAAAGSWTRRRTRRARATAASADRPRRQRRHGHRDPQALPRRVLRPQADLRPRPGRCCGPCAHFVRTIDENLDAGRGLWFYGRRGHRQDLAGHAGLQGGAGRRPLGGHLLRCRACWPRSRTPTTATRALLHAPSSGACARWTCSHLDDLGAEKRTEWVLEQLYSIVNERWQDERSIVVTTNISDLDELREQIGARTVSRLTEICDDPIPIMGADLRMAARAPDRRPGSLDSTAHAGTGDSRRPVGRRGQGQGGRPARRAGRRRDPLPGRQQRRPHDRPRRRDLQVPPDPVGDPLPRQAVRDRQRRGRRPAGAHRGDRRRCAGGGSTSAACASRPTPT